MFLTASNLVHYLIERGTIDINSVMNGQFVVMEAGRRNRNFKVLQSSGQGLFIKQVKVIDSIENTTLKREADCYRLAQKYAAWSALMPRFIDHDSVRQCLTVGLLDGAENLSEHHWRLQQFPTSVGTLLGGALGRFHEVTSTLVNDTDNINFFPRRIPWIFAFHRDNNRISGAVIALGELVRQHAELHESMDRLREKWHFNSVIHGDAKWDNCVVHHGHDNQLHMKIVDWELIDFGDNAWDVGGTLHSYLAHWIAAMPFAQTTQTEELISKTQASLIAMQPAIKAFWSSYQASSKLSNSLCKEFLIRCLEYAAARLLQTAFEYSYYSAQISTHALMLVHFSRQILKNPVLAAGELFGLEMDVAA